MKQSIFEHWQELLSDTEIIDRTKEEMILQAISLFFPNIDQESARFKQNYEIVSDWYNEFTNQCRECGKVAYLVGVGYCEKCAL